MPFRVRAPDTDRLAQALELLQERQAAADHLRRRRALFRRRGRARARSRREHGIPVAETIAGKGALTHDHPAHVGPIGIVGSTSANALAAEADVVLAIGTRLAGFHHRLVDRASRRTPNSSSINAARFDAAKHRALAVVGDARETLAELGSRPRRLEGATPDGRSRGKPSSPSGTRCSTAYQKPTNEPVPTYAQVVGVVNARPASATYLITAAGGLPGEVMKNWRVKAPNTFDCEFGFSCMGYEIAAGWGAAMADPTRRPIVMVGDGTYMMMNSDIYSSVLTGHKMIVDRLRQWRLCRDQPAAERQGRRRASTT